MTRFVRIIAVDRVGSPGERLRLEHSSSMGIVLACETVHPEQIDNPEARHYETHELIELTVERLRWLHAATGELLAQLPLDGVPQHTPDPPAEVVLRQTDDMHNDVTQTGGGVDDKFDKGGSDE